MFTITYSKQAARALTRMPANERKRVRGKIREYATNPDQQANNVKKLQGREGYRLRVGNWRVIFTQDGRVMAIHEIGARGGVY
ncbi:type II toxin-antitoxin system RelE family toxin [Magnetofaba australis]|nr:type II toxin-antitoxin system RelE/ParE family toxin [Magnetofaba australis]